MTTLSDHQIKLEIDSGKLVKNGDNAQVGPACYELRMGSIYYDLTENGRRIDAGKMGNVLIKPGHHVVLITLEKLEIPHNMLARVFSKGSLFSVGLSPVCTYADPGFTGNLGLVTYNLSDKYIEIPLGESIAKVDFELLSSDASNPYRGQHGFHTQIWPIKSQLQKTYEEVRLDNRVESEENEAFKILPSSTARSIRILQKRQKFINYSILIALLLNATAFGFFLRNPEGFIAGVLINIFSSALVGIIMWIHRSKE